MSTFKSPTGPLGYVYDGTPTFCNTPIRLHTVKSEFDVSKLTALPKVYVIYSTAGAEAALAKATKQGIVVVRSSRVGTGAVVPAEQSYIDEHFIDGDSLNPQKARVLLQLALTKTHDPQAIQAMFHKY